MAVVPLTKNREIHYPESDGRPMAESDLHRDEMVYLIEAMQEHFADIPDVYVSGNLLLYYVEGDPRSSVSPDALVAKGLDRAKERRRIYKVWEEGRMPCCVFEVTSPSTRSEDLRHKKALYADLGVEELFLYDPMEEYLHPSLQGFRLVGGEYQPIEPGPDGAFFSETTGLLLKLEGTLIHLVDPTTGKRLLRRPELAGRVHDAEQRAVDAEQQSARDKDARQAAESRAAALEEELARLRSQLAKETAG